jgi:phosphoglycerol transferase MdoB-like AlkP superfamily enzyme
MRPPAPGVNHKTEWVQFFANGPCFQGFAGDEAPRRGDRGARGYAPLVTKSFKITLWTGAGLLVAYALLRAGFFVANHAYFEGVSGGEIAGAFLHGLRFDVAGLLLLNLPVLVLFNLPLPTVKPRWYLRITFVLFALLNTVGFVVNLFDFEYYRSVQRRTLFEPFQRPQDLLTSIAGWYEEYRTLMVGGLLAVAVVVVIMALALRRLQRRIPETPGVIRSHVFAFLLVGLGVLGVRGGVQAGIMRPADAFVHSPSYAVGNLTLNSTYTVLLSAFLPRYPAVKKMPEADAMRIATAMVVQEGEHLLDPRYPFLRQRTPRGERRALNVVVFIQESWTASQVGPHEGGVSRTPFFDELASKGAMFTNFLATGQRSSEAVPSIVASVPSLFRRPIIGSQSEMVRYRGIGDILGEFDYDVSFHYGAAPTIEGFHGFTSMVGFDRYYSRDDYRGTEPPEIASDGKWGIYDELFYLDAAKRMDEAQGPFAMVIFGLSPHDPYRLPPNREAQFEKRPGETPYQHMLRYSDFSLSQFFAYARTRPWFENTVFLVTGDHTRFSPPESFYESFHVPLLVYAPALVEPQVRGEMASHADILPTILDLLRLPTRHASIGRSVFDTSRTRYCVVQRGQRFVIFDDHRAYMHDLRRELGLYDYRTDLRFRHDLAAQEPQVAADLREKLFAYLQACTTAVVEDRIWPRDP